jgi:hypothetical protein
VSQQNRSTFVITDPSEIVQALVGLKDVRVVHYERRGRHVALMVEQTPGAVQGDPGGEVAIAYRAKERLGDFYRCRDPEQAAVILEELQTHCCKRAMPPEVQRLGRTIRGWFDKIVNFHLARISNGPTEALNNLIKRIKRIGFGFRNFENYRIRALLYAGRPNWRVLGSIVVR